uniref:Uncharacterized protein n=1 Tax=Plectus sambesii TaxID=2011161 RepID=A0A914VKN5_9BILA
MALILLIAIAACLQTRVVVAQLNYNYPYNSAYPYNSGLNSNYPYNTFANPAPLQNSLNRNPNQYATGNVYTNTNAYAATGYNQLYQPNTFTNPYNNYNQYNSYGLNSRPVQANLVCEYRLFQGCVAPLGSGCQQCMDAGNAIVHDCQCIGGGGFAGK